MTAPFSTIQDSTANRAAPLLVLAESPQLAYTIAGNLRSAGLPVEIRLPDEATAVMATCRAVVWAAEGPLTDSLSSFLSLKGRPPVVIVGARPTAEILAADPDGMLSVSGLTPQVASRVIDAACERHRLRERIVQLEQFQHFLFTRADALCVVIDATGVVVDVSEAFARLVGFPRQVLMGRTALDLIAVADRGRAAIHFEQDFKGNANERSELSLLTADGRPARIVLSAEWLSLRHGTQPIIVYTGINVTDQRRAEQELQHDRRVWHQLGDTAPALLYVYDQIQQRNVYANRSIDSILGYSAEEVQAAPPGFIDSLIHPDDRAATDATRRRLQQADPGEIVASEYRMKHRDGSYRWLEGREAVLVRDETGVVRQITGVVIDVTSRKQAEIALRESEEQLRHAQKLEAVGVLASGIAHDFNNLLSAIRGYTSLARNSLQPGHAALESLEAVQEASQQAMGVAGALLTFARKNRAEKSPVHLPSIIEAAARLFRRSIPRNVLLEIDTAQASNIWVLGDATQLQQVVTNLLLNARDAVGEHGAIVMAARPGDSPLDAILEVRDTGIGMSAETRARIFEPFFTTKARDRGTGLGLAVVHGIVHDHAGTIDVETAPRQGSTFRVHLPTAAPPKDIRPPIHINPSAIPSIAVVVSENHLVRGLLTSMLSGLGYEVSQATSEAQVDEIAKGLARSVTLLVVDESVPNAVGQELAGKFVRDGHQRRAIIVSRTPISIPLENGSDSSIGRVAVLRKPFQMADLRAALVRLGLLKE